MRRQWWVRLAVSVAVAGCSESSGPPPPRTDVTPVDAATAGRIAVEVRYDGAPPAPKELNMRSVPACAAAHAGPVHDQSLVVTGGRLANAVVYVKEGFGGRAFAVPAAPVKLDQRGCLYTPHVVAVMVGQGLEVINSDPEAHNVRGRPRHLKAWNFMMSRQNTSRTLYFDRPELGIPVGCDIHPWMRAYVSVFEHPYFAVTSGRGPVTLETVPPGQYVVAVWHEQLGSQEQRLTLEPRGAATLQFTFAPGGR
jgi:plastocyanin